MKKLGSFLSRFQDLTPPNDAIKGALVAAILDTIDVSVTKKDIEITRGTAFVMTSSITKSMITLNRAAILAELYQSLPKSREVVKDVR